MEFLVIPSEAMNLGSSRSRQKPTSFVAALLGMTSILEIGMAEV
jgi:hypothetical protein